MPMETMEYKSKILLPSLSTTSVEKYVADTAMMPTIIEEAFDPIALPVAYDQTRNKQPKLFVITIGVVFVYIEDGCRVENHCIAPCELLENHNSKTQEQTSFSRRSFKRLHDRNPFSLGLHIRKYIIGQKFDC